jgi:hypothetical protein
MLEGDNTVNELNQGEEEDDRGLLILHVSKGR